MLRKRLTVVLIMLVSALPFGSAWYVVKHPELLRDRKKSNYGQFVTPPLPVDYAELFQNPVGAAAGFADLKRRWVLIQLSTAPSCGSVCLQTLHDTAQLRLLLNKEIPRVRRLLLVSGAVEEAALRALAEQDSNLLIARLSASLLQKLNAAAAGGLTDGSVLLLDPFANFMMRYDAGFDPYGMLRDLQKLLRASQIG